MAKKKDQKASKISVAVLFLLAAIVIGAGTYIAVNFKAVVDFAKTGKLYTHAQYEQAYKTASDEFASQIENYETMLDALRADLDEKDAFIIELQGD